MAAGRCAGAARPVCTSGPGIIFSSTIIAGHRQKTYGCRNVHTLLCWLSQPRANSGLLLVNSGARRGGGEAGGPAETCLSTCRCGFTRGRRWRGHHAQRRIARPNVRHRIAKHQKLGERERLTADLLETNGSGKLLLRTGGFGLCGCLWRVGTRRAAIPPRRPPAGP